jgi:hypothetical protein
MHSLINEETKIKPLTAKVLLTDDPDAVWTSSGKLPQSIVLDLNKTCAVSQIKMQFCGGFAAGIIFLVTSIFEINQVLFCVSQRLFKLIFRQKAAKCVPQKSFTRQIQMIFNASMFPPIPSAV